VSHELRGPANSILGLSRLLLDPTDGVGTAHNRAIGLISASAEELLDLVTQLLDLAKAESGKLDPVMVSVNLCTLLADVVASAQPLAMNGVPIRLAVSNDPLIVLTDQELLRQVVRNLLSNALAFTETGSVEVTASYAEDGQVIIEVIDSGIGLAPEHVERIFEEFFQVRGPLQTRRRGTGLGLPYSRGVVASLGGTLTASSTLWSGSTFRIALPAPAQTTDSGEITDLGAILVADDDDGFRTIVKQMLAPHAVRIVEASSGTAALELMRGQQFDVAVLDFNMPDLTGAEVMNAMAGDSAISDMTVVVITSFLIDDHLRSLTRGAAAVLSKQGLTQESLVATISGVSARSNDE